MSLHLLPCPRRLYTPRISPLIGRRPEAQRRPLEGNNPAISSNSRHRPKAVLILKENWSPPLASTERPRTPPSTALGKTGESRRSNSPRRCNRGQPRRYLPYHGRLQDLRISPGQLLAKRARSARRPNSRSAPKEHNSRIARKSASLST